LNSWKTGVTLTVALVAAATGGSGVAVAGPPAGAGDGRILPLSAKYRACDFSENDYVSARGAASGQAVVSLVGNTIIADVNLGVTPPFSEYRVRVIQIPRPADQPCVQGNPGVAAAMLRTDGNGIGSVTVSGPRQSGATGAWVFVDGPPRPGKIQGEFYTTDDTYDLG
jgi:hypothetical protein